MLFENIFTTQSRINNDDDNNNNNNNNVSEDKELKVPLDNDKWLIRFLRPCKFYPESAYELVKTSHHTNEKILTFLIIITFSD